jgi:hypothetical protein
MAAVDGSPAMAHFFERPDGLQRGKIFEQLYFHASGLSPAFLQAFMVAIQSSSWPWARASDGGGKKRSSSRLLTGLLSRHSPRPGADEKEKKGRTG